ncbi:MAG: DUF4399 domain-containing protein [Gammaproteobacteria bacterium]|jgi:hypothetical protein|nr:DUF4399 domain-containing protein [Gammaproteobacteria bacterium]
MNAPKYTGLLLAAALSACSNTDEAPTPAAPPAAQAEAEAPAAAAGQVFIVSPADGAAVTSPVTVSFGIEGFSVAPAGTYDAATGHHHLIIDAPLPDLDMPVPADANHIHFGKGQTETTLELEPGEHTLQLLLGDGNHVPHEPPLYSPVITITVTE